MRKNRTHENKSEYNRSKNVFAKVVNEAKINFYRKVGKTKSDSFRLRKCVNCNNHLTYELKKNISERNQTKETNT